mmetsp:Transcript_145038/g.404024  ORF Transcript_145038/g.404024 Transcript_145038/m.404024 type:complete len:328 (+) Transcript_145038:2333-3316(+)
MFGKHKVFLPVAEDSAGLAEQLSFDAHAVYPRRREDCHTYDDRHHTPHIDMPSEREVKVSLCHWLDLFHDTSGPSREQQVDQFVQAEDETEGDRIQDEIGQGVGVHEEVYPPDKEEDVDHDPRRNDECHGKGQPPAGYRHDADLALVGVETGRAAPLQGQGGDGEAICVPQVGEDSQEPQEDGQQAQPGPGFEPLLGGVLVELLVQGLLPCRNDVAPEVVADAPDQAGVGRRIEVRDVVPRADAPVHEVLEVGLREERGPELAPHQDAEEDLRHQVQQGEQREQGSVQGRNQVARKQLNVPDRLGEHVRFGLDPSLRGESARGVENE